MAQLSIRLVHFVIICVRRKLPLANPAEQRGSDLTHLEVGHPLPFSWCGVELRGEKWGKKRLTPSLHGAFKGTLKVCFGMDLLLFF